MDLSVQQPKASTFLREFDFSFLSGLIRINDDIHNSYRTRLPETSRHMGNDVLQRGQVASYRRVSTLTWMSPSHTPKASEFVGCWQRPASDK